jgi:hypothetical protein
MNTLENVKQWFIDRDLENGGRLDKYEPNQQRKMK